MFIWNNRSQIWAWLFKCNNLPFWHLQKIIDHVKYYKLVLSLLPPWQPFWRSKSWLGVESQFPYFCSRGVGLSETAQMMGSLNFFFMVCRPQFMISISADWLLLFHSVVILLWQVADCLCKLIKLHSQDAGDSGTIFLACDTLMNVLLKVLVFTYCIIELSNACGLFFIFPYKSQVEFTR